MDSKEADSHDRINMACEELQKKYLFLFQLSTDNPGNLVFSPLSLHVALTMLARGGSINTTTRIELLQALGFRGKYRRYLLRDLETFYMDLFEKYQVN